jgi:transposase
MKPYPGIDLHSTNSYLAMIEENGKRIFKKKLPSDLSIWL